MDCKVKRTNRTTNDYDVTFRGLTRGAVMSMLNALGIHEEERGSAVAGDVRSFLVAGIRASGDEEIVRSVLDAQDLAGDRISVTQSTFPPPVGDESS